MKLAPLLAQYLYTNKQLALPGIGIFTLDSTVMEEETDKQGKHPIHSTISFHYDPTIKQANDLVYYISTESGKMKALAAADLESYLKLAQEFINIGNPFLIEGIGNLIKTNSGKIAFSPGEMIPDKLSEYSPREMTATSSSDDSFTGYRNISYLEKGKVKWKRPAVFLLILAGLAFAIWGGYTVYKKTTAKNKIGQNKEKTVIKQVPVIDQSKVRPIDTTVHKLLKTPPGNYKFVIEEANRERGLTRYSALKGYGLDVRMETKDSILFKLFFVLPAMASDTTRILDSLSALYKPAWGKSYVEN